VSSLSKDHPTTRVASPDANSPSGEPTDIHSFHKDAPALNRETSEDRESRSSSTPDTSPDAQPIPSLAPQRTNKRKSRDIEEDEDVEEVASKKVNIDKKRKSTGIPAEERVPCLTYTKNSDGTWKIKERIKKVGTTRKPKPKIKPTYNFVKG
jgi:hypothetical protein